MAASVEETSCEGWQNRGAHAGGGRSSKGCHAGDSADRRSRPGTFPGGPCTARCRPRQHALAHLQRDDLHDEAAVGDAAPHVDNAQPRQPARGVAHREGNRQAGGAGMRVAGRTAEASRAHVANWARVVAAACKQGGSLTRAPPAPPAPALGCPAHAAWPAGAPRLWRPARCRQS